MNFNPQGNAPSSLADMNQRMQQWMQEKPSGNFDNTTEYRPLEGDIVYFHFVASGSDGDQFLKVYKSHVFDLVSKAGNRYTQHRYCPSQSGETETVCAVCASGNTTVKERMSFWMYVYSILHKVMPKDKQFQQVQGPDGGYYFNEEVNGWKVWHTSAWRESPWSDIYQLGIDYQGLNTFTARLLSVGKGMERRYKVYAMPNSQGLTPELYEQAKAECESIPSILRKQLASAVQAAPIQPGQANPAPNTVQPFATPGSQIPKFTFGQPQATPTPPVQPFTPLPVVSGQGAAIPTFGGGFTQQEPPVQQAQEPGQEVIYPFDTNEEEDNKRPMQRMF